MKRILLVVLGFILPILASRSAEADIVYDVTADYSSANNPNGVWTYGWQLESNIGTQPLNIFATNANSSGAFALFNQWRDDALGTLPLVGKYQSNTNSTLSDGTIFNANQVALHSGSGPGGVAVAVVRFTAPTAATYQISTAIFEYRSDIPGNRVYVFQNGNNLLQATTSIRGTTNSLSPFSTQLAAGDRLDFIVGSRNGAINSTTTQLNATITQITAVPEPSALTLCIAALLNCLFMRRRKLTS